MILCITPNPAIDRTLILPQLLPGEVHRAEKVILAAGGKGLNVARAIRRLGGDPLCMGFLGGHSGHLLADLTQDEGLNASWTWVDAETRAATILVSPPGDATLINEPGAPVSSPFWERLRKDVEHSMSSARIACISGSLPPGSSAADLHGLFRILVDHGKQVWIDTSGEALRTALAHPKVCLKVNGTEIGQALGVEVHDLNSARRALVRLGEYDLTAAVITLGAAGAVLATRDGRWQAQGPRVHVVSTVASGDVFLAGLVNALDGGKAWPEALGDAVAAGTANTLVAGGGRFDLQDFEKIRAGVRVEPL
jgi:1-phosphofructokinase family hexose kinase